MKNSFWVRVIAALWLGFVPVVSGWSYVLRTDDSGVYVVKWNRSPVTMQIKLSSIANLIDGNSQRSSVTAAMQAWNAQLGTVQLSPQLSSPGAYAAGNGVNEIVMDSTMDGDAFPAGVLAITLVYGRSNDTTETDIVFNTAYTWNSYRSLLRRGSEDLQRVAIHELGHVLGLLHPDESGQYVTAIMNSRESDLDRLWTDDIAGGRKLYGAPGAILANNEFAAATPITLSEGSVQVSGENMGGTRESGEPPHAGSTATHSVWWKWTASGNGSAVVTTLGSNFDTVLAVYTGGSLATLTPVASNDDEESIAENSTPQRKRTSKVTFSAVGGTTYYFAVDGWGSERTVLAGYTGSIALNLNFTVVAAPVFTSQPTDSTVAAGQTGGFVVGMAGQPFPDRKWQRRAAGTNDWVDVAYRGNYGGSESVRADYTGTLYLSVKTDISMDGDQFRCVASNLGGTVYSGTAVLHVTAIPLPVISAEPQSRKVLAGVNSRISVEASGAVSYQWYRNGSPLAGQTKPLLFFPDPQAGDAGDYTVVLTNPGGSVTSATAKITVGPPAVITNAGSTRRLVGLGETLSLSASASGTGPLSHQWYHDGRPISGATGTSYSRRISTNADAGAYWMAATDDMGTRHGAPVFVIVSRTSTNVVAWGANYDHQAEVPSTLADAVAVSAAPRYAVALRVGGSVQAWGNTGTMQFDFTNAVAVSAGTFGALVLQADGTVAAAGNAAKSPPARLKEVWAIATGEQRALALKTDGTVEAWGTDAPPVQSMEDIVAISPRRALRRDGTVMDLRPWEIFPFDSTRADNLVAIASGEGGEATGLKADGTMAWNWAPAAAADVVGIAVGNSHALALKANGTVAAWDGSNQYGEVTVPTGLGSVFAIAAGGDSSFAIRDISTPQPLLVTAQPASQAVFLDRGVTLSANAASGSATPPAFQWQRNGRDLAGATSRSLVIASIQPADAGIYTVSVKADTTISSTPAILGVSLFGSGKLAGAGTEVGSNILHPNGNIFDQILLQGAAASFAADYSQNQVTRLSFVDLDEDIVQVELSGPGTLSVVLDGSTGPAAPVNYNQPGVSYMKGHAGIVIAGADRYTNVSVFTVGRATAFDPTGAYNMLLSISASNDPARNGSPLFAGHTATSYDGMADIAFIAIASSDGRFGGVRTANANYFAATGLTGLYAPGVQFTGPVYLGDVTAFDSATPVIVIGSAAGETRITGGDLLQDNGRAVQVSGLTKLKFTAGSDSHGRDLPAQANRAVLQQDGRDVTAQIVVNPTP